MRVEKRQALENGRDYALRILKNNIIDLTLKPGSMVNEKELAANLELSRTPVREALQELARSEIIKILPQRGIQISLIDYNFVEEIQFARNSLENAVLDFLCNNDITEKDRKILEENVILQEFHLDNREKLMDLDNCFHRELFRIAGKVHLYEMMQYYSIHFDRVREMALHTVKDLKIVNDHRQIYEAIVRQDAASAKACMDEHLSRYHMDEKGIRELYPKEYFA
ncbi:MAG: GntR family transcriptional regulator [Clostridiales bacterium]|nr:GntR family transcriptional regulator [Clostridiales bacterium]